MPKKPLEGTTWVSCDVCGKKIAIAVISCPHCKNLTPRSMKQRARFESLEKLATW